MKIVLDAGHGGVSEIGGSSPNNATGPHGLLEKTVTLQVARAARTVLTAAGLTVLMTRDSDINLGIRDRAKVAKEVVAPAFVSIHFNAADPNGPPAQGTETWVGKNPTAVSQKLAGAIQAAVVVATNYRNRGVKSGAVSGVINNANQHSKTAHCLVEVSFLDRQPREEARLRTAAYIDKLGRAVADGVLAYLAQVGLFEAEVAFVKQEFEDAASAALAGVFSTRPLLRAAAPETESGMINGPRRGRIEHRKQTEAPPTSDGVPFIGDRDDDGPFADIAGRTGLDDPAQMLRGFTEAAVPTLLDTSVPEAQVADWNTVQAGLIAVLADARRAVARIVVPAGDFTNYLGRPSNGWNGTGFLVSKNILLTNNHVLNSVVVARAAEAEFDYEVSRADLLSGLPGRASSAKRYKLDPSRLFVTSPTRGGLDFTFVWIDEEASKEFGVIPMERASFTADKFDPVFVIHHPQGRLKEISLDDTEVLRMRSTVVHYAADTDFGSSGAPVFDAKGRLIALHHARNSDAPETLSDGRVTDILNEGIKIAAIAIDLENRIRNDAEDVGMARTVLGEMQGSDTLTGFFGALGRDTEAGSAVEAVVDAYTGTEQDIDIGFWNIEWLSNRWRDPARLEGAATVIADLGLDLWGLSEVSPSAVQALVSTLQEKFGESYEFALSEPDASDSKQSTAVIWKSSTVSGEWVDWPDEIKVWWDLDSTDDMPFEAIDGKVFNRYPGLFRFTSLGSEVYAPLDFYLVPLHLKAMAEGSKRRRLASLLLAKAIEKMITDGADADWVLGGDFNAELASGDFNGLVDSQFTPMSAEDESRGAFTYLKSPKSLIDNIFLSSNMKNMVGGADYFIVAREKTIDDYIKQVSDHRPILLRVSLGKDQTMATGAEEMSVKGLVEQIVEGRRGPATVSRRRVHATPRSPSE